MVLAMHAKRWINAFSGRCAMAMLGMACAAVPVWAQLPAPQHYGGVEYVTGGFGLEESNAIKAAMSDYPLVFTFAASDGKRAAYVSRVQVVVRDHYDATVLNVESQGPFLLARLSPGTYQVHATYRNQTQSRQVSVIEGKNTRLVFEWQREAVEQIEQEPATTSTAPETGNTFEFAPGSIPGLD